MDLRPGQELLIEAIGESSPAQSELVEMLGVAQPTVARAVKRLIAAGYVETGRDRADGRVVRVTLTSAGRSLLPDIRRAWTEVDERLLAVLSPDEQRTLLSLLNKIGDSDD